MRARVSSSGDIQARDIQARDIQAFRAFDTPAEAVDRRHLQFDRRPATGSARSGRSRASSATVAPFLRLAGQDAPSLQHAMKRLDP